MKTNNNNIEYEQGGVTAPKGFSAAGIYCGVRKNKTKKDLALILSDKICTAAAVYTQNLVKGAPIFVDKAHLSDGRAQAVICNSGNANTCVTGGVEAAEKMASFVERETGVEANDVIVASTGVIGLPLDVTPIDKGMKKLVAALGANSTDANYAIMTTDTIPKEIAVSFTLGGNKCVIGGIAKGSGMIHPNMATMLVFLTTDVNISSAALQKAISEDVKTSFNMISVDGDTSTNDTLAILANGEAGNAEIKGDGQDYEVFKSGLAAVTEYLCKKIARDGEGATKLVECRVTGAADDETARIVAKSVITSSLFKAAMFGADANWGRVLCAIGYSGADVDVNKIDVAFESAAGKIEVCKSGEGVVFDEAQAKTILLKDEITVEVSLNSGKSEAVARGCDLTYDYVKINGDYRT